MRKDNWPLLLNEVVERSLERQFSYGLFDCALFAADCALAITGIDYAEPFRGYDSKLAAYRIIAEHGSLAGMLTALLGEPLPGVSFAQRGDVVVAMLPADEGAIAETIGVCLGRHFAVPTPTRLGMVSMNHARIAWRVQ